MDEPFPSVVADGSVNQALIPLDNMPVAGFSLKRNADMNVFLEF